MTLAFDKLRVVSLVCHLECIHRGRRRRRRALRCVPLVQDMAAQVAAAVGLAGAEGEMVSG